jgi:hypothetical protein
MQVVTAGCEPDKENFQIYDVDMTNQSCNLEIANPTLEQAGIYTCHDGSWRQSLSLAYVIVLESTPICKSSAEEGKSLPADSEVKLTCSVQYSGVTAPVMEWTDEFGDIVPSSSDGSRENYVESTYSVKADGSTFRPYSCKTFFKTIAGLKSSSKTAFKATNLPKYEYSWTSKPVKAQKGVNPFI